MSESKNLSDIISKTDCLNILNQALQTPDFELINYQICSMSQKVGFLGDHKILNINLVLDNKETNLRFWMKFLPCEPGQREFLYHINGFKREMLVYKNIFDVIKKSNISTLNDIVIDCYLAKENDLLVLEYLENYKMYNKYEMFDFNHINIVFKSLAKLHAASVIFESKCNTNIGETFNDIFYEFVYKKPEFMVGIFNGIKFTIDTYFPEHDIENYDAKLRAIQEDFVKVTKRSNEYPNVLCHGDLYSTNAMFKYNDNNVPINCCIIDYQMARYLPQAHDVMSSLFLTTSRDLRQKHQKELLENYYKWFCDELAKYQIDPHQVITCDKFQKSCEEMYLFAVLQRAAYYQLVMIPKEVEKEYLSRVEMQERFLQGDRSQVISMSWEVSSVYKNLFGETHLEIIDLLRSYKIKL